MIEKTLEERAKTHGSYRLHSECCQSIKDIMHKSPNWPGLQAHQKETLEMVAHKVARILVGNPDEKDHWHDIQGYSKLSETIIFEDEGAIRCNNIKI